MLPASLRFFLKDTRLSAVFAAAVVFNLAAWVFAFLILPSLPETIFLHYTVYFGIDWVGHRSLLFILPASGTILGIINTTLAAFLYKNQKILSYFFASLTVALQALLLAEIFLLWRFNG